MRTTHTLGALQSLTLQREYHLKQEAVIRQKQRHAIIAQKKSKKPHIPSESSDHTEGVGSISSGDRCGSDVIFAARIANRLADTAERGSDGLLIYHTVEECDSLLEMLNLRGNQGQDDHSGRDGGGGQSPRAAEVPSEGNAPVQQLTNGAKSPNGTKSPKDDKVVIEELRVHNVALCGHIVDLLKEIELQRRQLQHFQRENGELKDRLSRLEPARVPSYMEDSTDSEKYYPVPIGMNLHDLPSLELPPLEMPKFDFSALKIDSED